tara:strand:+ start:1653 stop:1781 length:129 start_codon:yes stop_codon:yes gene_type:complete
MNGLKNSINKAANIDTAILTKIKVEFKDKVLSIGIEEKSFTS